VSLANNNSIQYPSKRYNSTQPNSEAEDFEDLIPFSSAVRNEKPLLTPSVSKNSQCHICNKIFLTATSLQQHPCNGYEPYAPQPRMHRPVQRKCFYPCYICSENFETLFSLNQHLDQHYSYIYKCERCSKQFEISLDLELHLYHTHEATIEKNRSFFGFLSSYNVQTSLEKFIFQENAIQKKYQCLECNKFFDTPAEVATHAELLYRCIFCFEKFKIKKDLIKHKTTEHGPKKVNVQLKRFRITEDEDSRCSTTLTSSSIDLQIKKESPENYQKIPGTSKRSKMHAFMLYIQLFKYLYNSIAKGIEIKLIKSNQLPDSIKSVISETMSDRPTYKCEVCDQEFHCTELLQQHTCLDLSVNNTLP
jgi:hypothetical protein